MVGLIEKQNSYVSGFDGFRAARAGEPSWLRTLREEGMDRFSHLGFPTLDDEDWRFTNVEPIAQASFRLGARPVRSLDRQRLERCTLPGVGGAEIVFVDGWFAPALSSLGTLPRGVKIVDLTDCVRSGEGILRAHLGRYAAISKDAFIALNAAYMAVGALVYIPRAVVLEGAIHMLFISTTDSAGTMTHPRNVIVAEENSQAAVVESYVATGDEEYFTNAVTEVVAGENSVLDHYMIVRDSLRSFNVSTLRVEQQRNSNFTSHSALLGGGLVRNNVHPVLNGEGCQSLLNGLYLLSGRQHMDNFMLVEHAQPHCDSRQFYKGIIDDEGRAVFSGRIIVHKNAQKTDAKQTNMNLLLSDKAQIDTKPQLEIYADDVKCTHGATIGQIDADALFYLRSRGLSQEAARSLLIYAFAGESLERMKLEPVRKELEKLLVSRLPTAASLGRHS